MMRFSLSTLGVMALAASVNAVTSFSDAQMELYLNGTGLDLAYAYAPIFFFSEALNKVPAYPTWAFSGSLSTPDTYLPQFQTAPAAQCQYPDVGCNARNPGVPKNSQSPDFPIYFTWSRCGKNEVRVVYNLYYQKDGAIFLFVQTGHDHDWERIIVVHTKQANGDWQPTKALYSAHQGYNKYDWPSIQNTLSTADAEAGLGPTPNGQQNLDHPKAYVSWSKHAMYHDRKTRYIDVVAQSTENAWRGQDWWRFARKDRFVYSDRGTDAGKAMEAANWGSAVSDPVEVSDGVCQEGA